MGTTASATVPAASASIRNIAWILAIVFIVGLCTYNSGYGDMRYKDPINDPYHTWVFWRHWTVPVVGIIMAMLVMLFIMEMSLRMGGGFLSSWIFLIVLACGVWFLFFLGWEVVIMAAYCNNVVGPDPVYPECINRDFPSKTFPDVTFLLMFIGNGILLFAAALCLFWINQVTCASTAKAYTMPTEEFQSSQIGKKMHHHQKKKKKHHTERVGEGLGDIRVGMAFD